MPLVKSLNAHKNGRNQHNANILVGDSESSDESEIELLEVNSQRPGQRLLGDYNA